MIYKVYALCYDRKTGEQVRHSEAGFEPSMEEINTEENEMFIDCDSILDIKERYERFWNRLNDYSDLVFVTKIEPVE